MKTGIIIYHDHFKEIELKDEDGSQFEDVLGEYRSVVTIRLEGNQLGSAFINDFGRQLKLPINIVASKLYGSEGSIVGPMIVTDRLLGNGEPEPLLASDISYIRELMNMA